MGRVKREGDSDKFGWFSIPISMQKIMGRFLGKKVSQPDEKRTAKVSKKAKSVLRASSEPAERPPLKEGRKWSRFLNKLKFWNLIPSILNKTPKSSNRGTQDISRGEAGCGERSHESITPVTDEKIKNEYGLGDPVEKISGAQPQTISFEIGQFFQTQLKNESEIHSYLKKQSNGAYLIQAPESVTSESIFFLHYKNAEGQINKIGFYVIGKRIYLDRGEKDRSLAIFYDLKQLEKYLKLTERHDNNKIKENQGK